MKHITEYYIETLIFPVLQVNYWWNLHGLVLGNNMACPISIIIKMMVLKVRKNSNILKSATVNKDLYKVSVDVEILRSPHTAQRVPEMRGPRKESLCVCCRSKSISFSESNFNLCSFLSVRNLRNSKWRFRNVCE